MAAVSVMGRFQDVYAERGLEPAPPVTIVGPEALPEPCRQLLHHRRNMTPMLEAFVGAPATLHVHAKRLSLQDYKLSRVITLECDGIPVELSSVVIHLDSLPEDLHDRIIEGAAPLGTMLIEGGIDQHSDPHDYLQCRRDPLIDSMLGLTKDDDDEFVYGRLNRLVTADGFVICDLVEIIPGPARLQAIESQRSARSDA